MGTAPSAPPLELCLNFETPAMHMEQTETANISRDVMDNSETPANSRRKGSLNWDREKGNYTHEWADIAEFVVWQQAEEHAYSIQFTASGNKSAPKGAMWIEQRYFVCGRQDSGGRKVYQKITESVRKIGSKKTGCHCKIVIKRYLHTPTILGRYEANHDHKIGLKNIPYTRLSNDT